MFSPLNATILLRQGGTYKAADLFRCAGRNDVFAQSGGGFIRLQAGSNTSKPGVLWDREGMNVENITFTLGGTPITR